METFISFSVDCEPNPCKNNGTCVDDIPAVWNVTCSCPAGYVGAFCQVDFDECASDPCQNGATCVDHVDYFTCVCASGWDGECKNVLDRTGKPVGCVHGKYDTWSSRAGKFQQKVAI